MRRVVLDTNVLVAALRSRHGASFELLSRVGSGQFDIAVSVPLVLEYEDALSRHIAISEFAEGDTGAIIDYMCSVAIRQDVFFLWRPFLRDPGDDLVLEVAVAAACDAIVTHNVRDFEGIGSMGLRTMTPGAFLQELRARR